MKKIYYFAYGSNMNKKDLKDWCNKKNRIINLRCPKVSSLTDYKLSFTHYSTCLFGGTADIIKSDGYVVYGVLFETDETSLKNLDKKEGVNSGVYKRIKVKVKPENTPDTEAITYDVINKVDCKPSKKYLNIIIEGAKEHYLPKSYIECLKTINMKD